MNRDTIYVFESGEWCWNTEYTLKTHSHLGRYQEFLIGQGFNDEEVCSMVMSYLNDLWADED